MQCWICHKELDLREYAWTHRHEPPWYLKAIGAVMMGIGIGSILFGVTQIVIG